MAVKKGVGRKIIKIALSIVQWIFFIICVVALILAIYAKRNSDGAVSFFGKQMRIVTSSSMEKCDQTDVSGFEIKSIPIKSMVFIDCVPKNEADAERWYASLRVGDVLTFKYVYTSQVTITHRITEIIPKEGGYVISLEGDNKSSESGVLTQTIDTSLTDSPNYIIGRVVGQSYGLGLLLTAINSPVGMVCIIIVPCLIIMVLEIFRIVNTLTEKKREAEKEAQKKKDEELQELRQQLIELRRQADGASDGESAADASKEVGDSQKNE